MPKSSNFKILPGLLFRTSTTIDLDRRMIKKKQAIAYKIVFASNRTTFGGNHKIYWEFHLTEIDKGLAQCSTPPAPRHATVLSSLPFTFACIFREKKVIRHHLLFDSQYAPATTVLAQWNIFSFKKSTFTKFFKKVQSKITYIHRNMSFFS